MAVIFFFAATSVRRKPGLLPPASRGFCSFPLFPIAADPIPKEAGAPFERYKWVPSLLEEDGDPFP